MSGNLDKQRNNPSSWVISSKETGNSIFETSNPAIAKAINLQKYSVEDIYTYLYRINDEIKACERINKGCKCGMHTH